MGLFDREHTFFPLQIEDSPANVQGAIGGFAITTSQQVTHHTRSIYSFLDFLGDVGGLFDMLRLVIQVLLQLLVTVSGSGLDAFLLESIFKESRGQKSSAIQEIRNRKSVFIGWSLCCFSRETKRHRMLQKGLQRIEREQDFVGFVKKQIRLDSALKVLFSKTERFFLAN